MNPSETRELYARLGLSRQATAEEIKKSYRKLAIQWHPDKNPDNPQAHQEFIAVSEAYEVLSDPQKRALYDSSGDIRSHRTERTQETSPPKRKETNFDDFIYYSNIFTEEFTQKIRKDNIIFNVNEIKKKKNLEEIMRGKTYF